MFFKKFKQLIIIFVVTTFIMPQSILAYSNKIIAGGDTIGIEIKTDGVIISGFYKIDSKYPNMDTKLQKGDTIIKAGDVNVSTVDDFINAIKNSNGKNLNLTCKNVNGKEYNETIKLISENGTIKTGLYVKDTIAGLGTLTFIDNDNFGALGHEVTDSSSNNKVDIKDGKIYSSKVTSIDKSVRGEPGSKRATTDDDKVFGIIKENTNTGIFGKYNNNIKDSNNLYSVGKYEDIKIGNAKMITVIEKNIKKEYDIEIIKKNNDIKDNKNILFEVTDKELLEKTGGIVQGMSGSPIVQDGKIIGAVTNVVVNDPKKGYGVLITTMLEEAEN